jgi:transcriptional regulator with XRE-family HTH domain
MTLGNTFRKIRRDRNLMQEQVALDLGISQTYLSQIESNKKEPSLPMLRLICDYYKIPVPIIMWMSMEVSDVSKGKRKYWNSIKESVDNLISEFYP